MLHGSETVLSMNIRKIILLKRNVPKSDFCNFIENSEAGPILILVKGRLNLFKNFFLVL